MEKPFALIVEDDRDTAALFRHAIDMAGFLTEIAFNGKIAYDRLSTSKPDIVILDLNLPGISGKEILEMIQKDERLKHTNVIVITAHANIAESLSVQPDLVLVKPVNIDQLATLISRFKLSNETQKAKIFADNKEDNSIRK